MTPSEVRALDVTVDIPTAGRCFRMGRDTAYRAAKDGTFPCPVLRIGNRLLVLRSALLDALGLEDDPVPTAAVGDVDFPGQQMVITAGTPRGPTSSRLFVAGGPAA
jgi:hypothetical protein